MTAEAGGGGRDVVHVEPRRFRDVLGHLPTGVTVITAHGASGPTGMAANSVTSVSLDPPLILLCPAKCSATWPKIRSAGAFCVNVMASHHEELTRTSAATGVDRFAGIDVQHRSTGPALTDAIAWLECRLRDEHDAGDHTIAVAQVVAIEAAKSGELAPLVFFRGGYGAYRRSDGAL